MKRKITRYAALLLLSAAAFIMLAAAAATQSNWSSTITDDNGNNYHGRSFVNTNQGLATGSASTITLDNTKVMAGYAGAEVSLYRNDERVAYAGPQYNSALATGVTVTSPRVGGAGNYKASGVAYCWNADSYRETSIPNTPIVQISSRSAALGNLAEEGNGISKETLAVYVNEAGERYGTALGNDLYHLNCDLTSAIGIHGVKGYIRTEDMPKIASSLEEARAYVPHDRYIPVYKSDGKTVIDSFLLGSGLEE